MDRRRRRVGRYRDRTSSASRATAALTNLTQSVGQSVGRTVGTATVEEASTNACRHRMHVCACDCTACSAASPRPPGHRPKRNVVLANGPPQRDVVSLRRAPPGHGTETSVSRCMHGNRCGVSRPRRTGGFGSFRAVRRRRAAETRAPSPVDKHATEENGERGARRHSVK